MNNTIDANVPIICAECDHASIHGHYLFCEKTKKTVYNAKPKWCPFPTYPEDAKKG